jgi:DNA-binding PadR family transcriptional regulator
MHVEKKMKGGFSSAMVLYAICSSEEAVHGYDIIRKIGNLTSSSIVLHAGTVYPILRNLERLGLVTYTRERSVRGPKRKAYTITDDGKKVLSRFDRVLDVYFSAIVEMRRRVETL